MGDRARVHVSYLDVCLMLDGFEHTTWGTNTSTVMNSDKGVNYISQSVVNQMLEIAYAEGAKKAASQLQQIRTILGT